MDAPAGSRQPPPAPPDGAQSSEVAHQNQGDAAARELQLTAATASPLGTPEVVGNPFSGNGKLQRSPAGGAVAKQKSTAVNKAAAREKESPLGAKQQPKATDQAGEKMTELLAHIQALQDYVKGRHNVHHEIKRLINLTSLASANLEREIRLVNKTSGSATGLQQNHIPPRIENGSQTSPSLSKPSSGRLFKPRETAKPQEVPRAAKRKVQQVTPRAETVVDDRSNLMFANKRLRLTSNREAVDEVEPVVELWSTVAAKTRRPKIPLVKPVRADAIVIAKAGELSYSDIIKKMKGEASLTGLGDNVARVRRTAKGEVLIQLKRTTSHTTQQLKEEFDKVFAGQTTTRTLTQETLIEVKDLDEVTTAEEVGGAIRSRLNLKEETFINVKSLRKAYGGTQIAVVSLPSSQAIQLTSEGKLKVGWIIGRVREKISPTRCFKCLEFGHTARMCKNTDRSACCMKCGKEGHKAAQCQAEPRCFLCIAKKLKETNHRAGSWNCPSFQEANKNSRR